MNTRNIRPWAISALLFLLLGGLALFLQNNELETTVKEATTAPSQLLTGMSTKVPRELPSTPRRVLLETKDWLRLTIVDSVRKTPVVSASVYLFGHDDLRKPSRELSTDTKGELLFEQDKRILGWSVQKNGYYSKVWTGAPVAGGYELEPAKPVRIVLRNIEHALSSGLRLQASMSYDFSRKKDLRISLLTASMERSKRLSIPRLVGSAYEVFPPRHAGIHFIVVARGTDHSYPFGLAIFEKGVYEYEIDVPRFDMGPATGSLSITLRLPGVFETPVDFHLKSKHGDHPVDAAFAPRRVTLGTGLYSAYIPNLPDGQYWFEILFLQVGLTYRSKPITIRGETVYEGSVEGRSVTVQSVVPESHQHISARECNVLAYGERGIHMSGEIRGPDGIDRLFIPKDARYLMGKAGRRELGTHPYSLVSGTVPVRIVLEPLFKVRLDFGSKRPSKELIEVHDLTVDFKYPLWTRRSSRSERKVFLVAGGYRLRRKGGAWVELKLPRDANKTFSVPGRER